MATNESLSAPTELSLRQWTRHVLELTAACRGRAVALLVLDCALGLLMILPPAGVSLAVVGLFNGWHIAAWSLPLLLSALVVAGLRQLRAMLAAQVTVATRTRLTDDLYERVMALRPTDLTVIPRGSMNQLFSEDVPFAAGVLANTGTLVNSIVTFITVLTVVVFVLPAVVLPVAFVGLATSLVLALTLDRSAVWWGRAFYIENLSFSTQLLGLLDDRAIVETRLLGIERRTIDEIREGARRAHTPLLRYLRAQSLRDFALTATLGVVATACAVVAVVSRSTIEPALVLWTVLLIRSIEAPLVAFAQARGALLVGGLGLMRMASVQRMVESKAPSSPRAPDRHEHLRKPLPPLLEFRRVCFSFSETPRIPVTLRPTRFGATSERIRETLWDVDFGLAAGSTVCLIGPSGAGKSTIALLITGLYKPTSGAVVVDGLDTRAPDFRIGDACCLVSGKPWLVDDSILANVGMAAPNCERNDVLDACNAVGLSEMAEKWPLGLHTVIGSDGALLSSGERQRLAIARALLRRPRLLVLDEATAALDIAGEASIFRALRERLPDAGIVFITHRISSAQLSNSVLVLEMGRIVSRGTPDRALGAQVAHPS